MIKGFFENHKSEKFSIRFKIQEIFRQFRVSDRPNFVFNNNTAVPRALFAIFEENGDFEIQFL